LGVARECLTALTLCRYTILACRALRSRHAVTRLTPLDTRSRNPARARRPEEIAQREKFHRAKNSACGRFPTQPLQNKAFLPHAADGTPVASWPATECTMQIPSLTSGLLGPRNPSPIGSTSGSGATASLTAVPSQDDSVEQAFLNYAKMSPMERLRANILKSMGLTEDQLKSMPPEQQKAVEQKIEQLIKEQLEKNADKQGQVVDVTA
jgi:hypothetical protein